jgi:Toprim domain-containing protein/uncharacterized protein DUF3991
MNNQLKSFRDFRSEISIMELALGHGYCQDKKKGNKWPVLVHPINDDRIIIANPASCSNQGYWNPNDDRDKGTLINFVKNRLGTIFPTDRAKPDVVNINQVLYSWLKMDHSGKDYIQTFIRNSTAKKKEFSPSCLEPLTNAAFLYSRGISKETINAKEFKTRIYNIRKNNFCNIAFPYYTANGKIAGIEIRNANYKKHADGSDRSNAIWCSVMPEKLSRIILCESAIDALSYYQLKKPEDALYISFGGTVTVGQINTVKSLKTSENISEDFSYISAVDNDKDGEKYNRKFSELLADHLIIDNPVLKDYNEDITNYLNVSHKAK